jgi:hypothetical protein
LVPILKKYSLKKKRQKINGKKETWAEAVHAVVPIFKTYSLQKGKKKNTNGKKISVEAAWLVHSITRKKEKCQWEKINISRSCMTWYLFSKTKTKRSL